MELGLAYTELDREEPLLTCQLSSGLVDSHYALAAGLHLLLDHGSTAHCHADIVNLPFRHCHIYLRL